MLHEVEGYEHQEIAKLLDCSVGNSKSQRHKAKLRIREFLTQPGIHDIRVETLNAAERNSAAQREVNTPRQAIGFCKTASALG